MSLKGDVFYEGGPVSVGDDSGAVDLQWLDFSFTVLQVSCISGDGCAW